jgi:hypothetical protein
MTRNAGMLLIVTMLLVSTGAWAGPLSLALGETKFFGFSARSTKVELSDDSVVSVRTSRSGVELQAKRPGVSHVTLRLRGGETYEFDVHVTPRGAEVYSTNRAEPEHSEFILTPAPVKTKSRPQVSKAQKDEPRPTPKKAKAASPRA